MNAFMTCEIRQGTRPPVDEDPQYLSLLMLQLLLLVPASLVSLSSWEPDLLVETSNPQSLPTLSLQKCPCSLK